MVKRRNKLLDVSVRLGYRHLETDYIKPTDTHQFLDSTSCYPYHCKKIIPYTQDSHTTGFALIMKSLINTATT